MIEIEEFRELLDELIKEIPEEYYKELNGGVLLMEEEKIHPDSRNNELRIMGEYVRSRTMGRLIYIYFGSFKALYSHVPLAYLKNRVRETLRHELTHHLESLAGERDLEIEDEVSINRYLNGQ